MEKRYINDLKSIFKDASNCKNDLVYEFYNIIPSDMSSDLLYGTSIIYPGTVNGEYYMTKGHFHNNINTAEVYYGLEGSGLVYMQSNTGNILVEKIEPNKVVYVLPNYAHRVINNTDSILKFFCVCRADAGHDYNIEFNKRFFKD